MMEARETRWRVWVAAVWLGVQVWLPVSWYLGDEPLDERFAWRMFSDAARVRCDLRLTVRGEHPQPREHFQVGWLTLARRGRPSVLRGMAQHLCAQSGEVASVDARCLLSGGTVRQLTVHAAPPCGSASGP